VIHTTERLKAIVVHFPTQTAATANSDTTALNDFAAELAKAVSIRTSSKSSWTPMQYLHVALMIPLLPTILISHGHDALTVQGQLETKTSINNASFLV
jgi:hypothetical protein